MISEEITNLNDPNLVSDITLLGQGFKMRGEIVFDQFTRIHGEIEGKIRGLEGSLIILGETASHHGEIECCELIIDGFVKGNVTASKKVTISESGSLIGDIESPHFEIKFGGFFEGNAITTKESSKAHQ